MFFWKRKDKKKVDEVSGMTLEERKEMIDKLEKLKEKMNRKVKIIPKKEYQ